MPIVRITLYEGRDEETKAGLAREIADAVAEHTGNSISEVHVIFDEVSRSNWSRGITLASRRTRGTWPPAPAIRAEYASLSVIKYDADPAREAEDLRLRRTVINRDLAAQRGFVSSLLLRPHDREHEYLLISKWMSRADADAHAVGLIHDGSPAHAGALLGQQRESVGADIIHLDQY